MAEVVWAGRGGELVETVIAVLLSRRFPLAERIRASRGDGGIDVQIPSGDGWEIFQIKSYTRTFRKAHVERSFLRLKSYAAETGINITQWSLIMPLDPSKEARRWLSELTDDAGFSCAWPGKIYVDGLAAQFPEVIEYYFGDGAARLAETVKHITAITGTLHRAETSTLETPLVASDAIGGLASLHAALNKFDPHFVYDFHVSHSRPETPAKRDLLFSRTSEHNGSFVTFRVFERYRHATDDRQASMNFALRDDAGPQVIAAFEDFLDYGTPFHTESGLGYLELDLPGGLGGTFDGGGLQLGTPDSDQDLDRQTRIQLLSPDGDVIAETRLNWNRPTFGIRQPGVRTIATEVGGCFVIESRKVLGQPQTKALFTFGDLTGKAPAEVIAGLEFLRHLRHPNLIRTAPLHGPITSQAQPIPPDRELADVTFMLDLAKALATIQDHTTARITFPTDEQTPMHELTHIIWVAKLLRGGPAPFTANSLAFELDPTAADMISQDGPQPCETAAALVIRLDGNEINLGQVLLTTASAHLTVSRGDDAIQVIASGPDGQPLVLDAQWRASAAAPPSSATRPA